MQSRAKLRTKSEAADGDNLWKKGDVTRRANVSLRTVDYWIERNEIPFIKFRGGVRFIPADVNAFIQSRRIGGSVNKRPLGMSSQAGAKHGSKSIPMNPLATSNKVPRRFLSRRLTPVKQKRRNRDYARKVKADFGGKKCFGAGARTRQAQFGVAAFCPSHGRRNSQRIF